ncbi:MAG: hypothetical protein CMC13_14875 [Flavobacteriaceae bacterium]|nr:hypothetical protein [Flavobacteriaceae bacterium]|tara:strand:+ start:94239 stop:94562 length:324 start_codon:yes stop_codon:yes gene_type:complete
MEKLDQILNRISRSDKSLKKLQKKVKGVFLGSQLYLIEDYLYYVDFVFEKFLEVDGTWISDISINHPEKVKKAIFDNDLKELLNERIFEVLIQLTKTDNVFKIINRY